jgi:predicted PurR-regulated permease PerM
VIGATTALIAFVAGFGAPVLWGVFAFVICFIPFFGVSLTTAALISAGFMVYDGVLIALAPAAIFLVFYLVCENAVLPAYVGRRFEINPFLVFVSIVFWTWMWGAQGAILAAPLLLVGRTIYSELYES